MTQMTVFAGSGNLASTSPTNPYSSSSLNFTCTVVLSTIFRLGCAMNCTLLPRLMSNSSNHRGATGERGEDGRALMVGGAWEESGRGWWWRGRMTK
jgi:hypothetical protein